MKNLYTVKNKTVVEERDPAEKREIVLNPYLVSALRIAVEEYIREQKRQSR